MNPFQQLKRLLERQEGLSKHHKQKRGHAAKVARDKARRRKFQKRMQRMNKR